MKNSFLLPLGLACLSVGFALPGHAQGTTSPPLPSGAGQVPVSVAPRGDNSLVTPAPTLSGATTTPTPTPRRLYVDPSTVDNAATPPPLATPGRADTLPAPTPTAGVTLASPTPTPGGPVLPTATEARAQAGAVTQLRRLIRDVQTNSDNVKASGNFGAQLYLVADETFFQDWRKPETPTIAPLQLATRGQPAYTVIIFYGPARDDKGLSNVSYDLTVRRPDGSVYTERKDVVGWQNFAPNEKELLLGRNYIGINIQPNDPAGLYSVEALVHDNVARVVLPLKQTFAVQ